MRNVSPEEMAKSCELLAYGKVLTVDDEIPREVSSAIESIVDGLGCRDALENKPITPKMYYHLTRAASDWIHARRWLVEFPRNVDAEDNDE